MVTAGWRQFYLLESWSFVCTTLREGFESTCNAGSLGSISGLRRSPREGNSSPLQHPCLENSMDRGTWRLQSMGSWKVEHAWLTFTAKGEGCLRGKCCLVICCPCFQDSEECRESKNILEITQLEARAWWDRVEVEKQPRRPLRIVEDKATLSRGTHRTIQYLPAIDSLWALEELHCKCSLKF